MEIIAHGNIKALNLLDLKGYAFIFGGPDVFKILVKIAFGALEVIGAYASFNSMGEAVATNPVHIRSSSHGFLPGELLAFCGLLAHGMVILTARAIIVVVAIFKFSDTCLHPEARVIGLGFFVGLDHPDLSSHDGSNLLFGSKVRSIAFAIRRSESHATSAVFCVFVSHFSLSFDKLKSNEFCFV
jgi:hypothetical protein